MLIEQVREFWNEHPCNFRHSVVPTNRAEYSREVTWKKYFVEPHIVSFVDFDMWRGRDVLDAGCGIGTMALDFLRAGAHLTAVDLSDASIRIAVSRAIAENLHHGHSRYICENLEVLDENTIVHDRKYDLIFSFGVVHHTPNPSRALRALRAMVADDGELRLMIYHTWSTKALWLILTGGWPFRSAARCVARQSEANSNCPIAFTYSRRQAARLLRASGWEPTSIKIDHIFPYQIARYKRGEYKRKWYWRWMPGFVFRAFERLWGWHILVKAKPDKISVRR